MSYEFNLFKKIEGQSLKESRKIILNDEEFNAVSDKNFSILKKIILEKIKNYDLNFNKYEGVDHLYIEYINGIDIEMTKNHVTIIISPVIDTIEAQKDILIKVFNYLFIFQQITNYTIYDPQFFKEVELDDKKTFVETYIGSFDKQYHIEQELKERRIYYKIVAVVSLIVIVVLFFK